jgi:hypothetical protein
MFSCRIRLMSEAWQSSFVYMSTSIPQVNGGPPAYLPGHSNGYFPSLEGWTSSWISFEVAIGAVVELEITKEFDDHVIWSATVQPAERAVASIVGNRAIIRLTGAQQFTVDIDGALQEHNTGYATVGPYASHQRVVHTFTVYANPRLGVLERPSPYDPDVRTVTPGETPPTIFSESMLYFLPGVHNITNMPSCCVTTDFSASCPCVKHNNSWPGYVARYELQSGKSYYIPSDAWLNGGITTAPSISGTRVFGYGHISGHLYRWKLGYGNIGGLITNWINDTHIVGPMFVDFPNHNILGQGSVSRIDPLCAHPACIVTKNTLRHIKTLGWRSNSDGVHVWGHWNENTDLFLRTSARNPVPHFHPHLHPNHQSHRHPHSQPHRQPYPHPQPHPQPDPHPQALTLSLTSSCEWVRHCKPHRQPMRAIRDGTCCSDARRIVYVRRRFHVHWRRGFPQRVEAHHHMERRERRTVHACVVPSDLGRARRSDSRRLPCSLLSKGLSVLVRRDHRPSMDVQCPQRRLPKHPDH